MWLNVSAFAALCVLIDVTDGTVPSRQEMERIFQERSKSEWEEAWHRERYGTCRETLLRHLYWACEKDIYRLTRRSQPTINIDEYRFPWIADRKALTFLRPPRRSGSSITTECCTSKGCTWEEYAEYCPTNKRKSFV